MAQPDNAKLKRLIDKLKELFQLDQPELDFGIYRIMHARSGEVTQFLEEDLLPQVREAFAQFQSADGAEAKRKLQQLIAQLSDAGVDPGTSPKVQDLRAKLAGAVDIASLENEVYDHLYTFFRRYYAEGDFLSKRVYKDGVYAIPYEGEEVKLYWANHDQYYIKTNEYLRDYAFRLRPDNGADPMRVHFKLVDAAEGEHGNVKAAEGKERQFILAAENFISEEAGELSLRFEYRPARVEDWPEAQRSGKDKPPSSDALIAIAEQRVFAANELSLQRWLTELQGPHTKAGGEQAEYSRLVAHLRRYTARHTFDYFIHKDLGGFLRRELDFYIKNEVMRLDDIESESAPKVEQYLSKIKAIRRIAGKIIDFLEQLENFQKKLWEKKKLVVETNYCFTLSAIPRELYSEVVSNRAQIDEWIRLYALEDVALTEAGRGVTEDFLLRNQSLIVDTVHFGAEFTQRLLESIPDIDDQLCGLLVHSDNFQALHLMSAGLHQRIKCAYIDPPYNTNSSAILYKNNYRHSSWGTLLRDRLEVARELLRDDGVMFVSIDKTERTMLEHALDEAFGADNQIEELIWTQATANGQLPTYATNHEYVEVYARNRAIVESDRNMFREPKPGFAEISALVSQLQPNYPPISHIEAEIKRVYSEHQAQLREECEFRGEEWDAEAKRQDTWKGIYPYDRAEYRDKEGRLVSEDEAAEKQATIWVWREIPTSAPASKQSPTTKDSNHFNFRYYKPSHPITGKPCPHPKSGWKFPYKPDPRNPDRRSFVELDSDQRIAWGGDETKVPQTKGFLREVETNVPTSVFYEYNDGEAELSHLFGSSGLFLSPKSSKFVRRFIAQTTREDEFVIDFFGGSGSTAHAVVAQNRIDGGRRKYVTVEVGAHFDTLLLPRMKKVAYSLAWSEGKPTSISSARHCFKYLRLESYEDATNNLDIRRTEAQQSLLDHPKAGGAEGLRETYLLRYQLEVESRGSASLLAQKEFSNPFGYKLKIRRPGSDESSDAVVDLLETFNYLIGLSVGHIAATRSFAAEFQRDTENRLRLKDRLRQREDGPWSFRTVSGRVSDGRKTLIVWRTLTGNIEQDNLVLEEWFSKQGYSTKDSEFKLIYVNGGNTLENLKSDSDNWKVRLIEEDFHRLMFDSAGG